MLKCVSLIYDFNVTPHDASHEFFIGRRRRAAIELEAVFTRGWGHKICNLKEEDRVDVKVVLLGCQYDPHQED